MRHFLGVFEWFLYEIFSYLEEVFAFKVRKLQNHKKVTATVITFFSTTVCVCVCLLHPRISSSHPLVSSLPCPALPPFSSPPSNLIIHFALSPLPPSEERVGPLEVSRSKLSRHLQGLVFRCHKCTFTCSSDQALQLHLQKHDEIKPYQCQLCYYDSSRRSQLEEHLRLEHKVSLSPHKVLPYYI